MRGTPHPGYVSVARGGRSGHVAARSAICPGITVAAMGVGEWYGGLVLAGVLGGLWLRGYVEERSRTTR